MKILNFGSLNNDYVYDVHHITMEGETQASLKRSVFCGGKGLNQSVALKRAGLDVVHAGAVGISDSDLLLNLLKDEAIETGYIIKKEMPTGHAIIQRDRLGSNNILLYGGANQAITQEDIDKTLANFEKNDVLFLQNEISEMNYLLNRAAEKEMVTVLNPSPITEALKQCDLNQVDYLILNEHEAFELCGENRDAVMQLKELQQQWPKAHIVLTLGDKGAYYQYQGIQFYQPAIKVNVVDTTAAGDTFTGFFMASILDGASPEKALLYAAKASAIAVTREGAAPSIPFAKEII
jgi:ribokinase